MHTRRWCTACNNFSYGVCESIKHGGTNPTIEVLITSGADNLARVEERLILLALDYYKHNRTHAAESLGISTRTLQRKLKRMGI